MLNTDAVRVLMYSHDTFGLGHLTRTVRIARAIRSRYENVSILILSGSPVAPYFALPPDTDLIKLPSVIKAGRDHYESRDLRVSFSRIKRLRRELIRSTAEAFRPHLLLVDNVPLGMKGEILPTLRFVRATRPSTKIILDLRDILDDPTVIHEAWERDGVPAILEEYYDKVFVLGDPSLFDAAAAYDLPSSKTSMVGYAAPASRDDISPPAAIRGSRQLLVTAGGGGDGFSFLGRILTALVPGHQSKALGPLNDLKIDVVTGPLMDRREREDLQRWSESPMVELHEFVPDLPRRMAAADLVVAMAGYNTCCEILSHAHAALLYPRAAPRVEQFLRAEAFQKDGLASMLDPEASEESIVRSVTEVLEVGPRLTDAKLPMMEGLSNLAEELCSIHPSLRAPGATNADRSGEKKDREGDREFSNVLRRSASPKGNYWYWPGATTPGRTIQS